MCFNVNETPFLRLQNLCFYVFNILVFMFFKIVEKFNKYQRINFFLSREFRVLMGKFVELHKTKYHYNGRNAFL
jgi:hypothetical protein